MNNFNQIKDLYTSILHVNLQIAEYIEKKDYNEMILSNNQKNELLAKVNSLRKNVEFNEEEKVHIDKIISEIRAIDTKNIKIMEDERDSIKRALKDVSKNQKVMNAYSIKRENRSNLLDVKE